MLAANTTTIKEIQYSVKEPLVIVFNVIEELKLLAEAANDPFTPVQLLEIGIQVIKNSHDFENGLLMWFQLPIRSRDWTTFKTHFEAAYAILKVVRGPMMKSTAYHQANILQTQVLNWMQDVKLSVDQALAQIPSSSSSSQSD